MSVRRLALPLFVFALLVALLAALPHAAAAGAPVETLTITPLGSFDGGDAGSAEIVAHDPATQRLFVVNAVSATVDVLDVSNPAAPTLDFTIDVTAHGAVANSVAVKAGVVAVAVQATDKTQPGHAAFYDTAGTFLAVVEVGALPDMLIFTPDGQWLLVANEGEPNDDYTVDPEGSVSLIDLSDGAAALVQSDVTSLDFADFNVGGVRAGELPAEVRLFGPGATVAQDLEPEYIAVSADSTTAWVTLQENNAVAVVDIEGATFSAIKALGFKDHNLPANALDPSDRDGGIQIAPWPVMGMYLPDGIAAFQSGGASFLVTGNEGDSRDYAGFSEETRIGDEMLDPTAFPNAAALQDDAALGRLKITTTMGDTDSDGDYDTLYSFGARSFTIWAADGTLVYDSGSQLEQLTAALVPTFFNSNGDPATVDSRSDDKGPEPENVATGEIGGTPYIFVGLERTGGVIVFDVTVPTAPLFAAYADNRDAAGNPIVGGGDISPEGVLFIPASASPTGKPLLVTANEISGTTTVYEIALVPTAVTLGTVGAAPRAQPLALLGGLAVAGLLALAWQRRRAA